MRNSHEYPYLQISMNVLKETTVALVEIKLALTSLEHTNAVVMVDCSCTMESAKV